MTLFKKLLRLIYVHKYLRLKVIHRDSKVKNILLDQSMHLKISITGKTIVANINNKELPPRTLCAIVIS